MNNVPIAPIEGVSDALIQVLNDRFRRVSTAAVTATSNGKGTGTGAAGPPGPSGADSGSITFDGAVVSF